MRRFTVPIFRSWDEASRNGFFTKTTWKKRGQKVSKLEPDGVIVLKTLRISADWGTWKYVIDVEGDYLIVAEEWFELFSKKLVFEGSAVPETLPDSVDSQIAVVSKVEEVPRVDSTVPEILRRKKVVVSKIVVSKIEKVLVTVDPIAPIDSKSSINSIICHNKKTVHYDVTASDKSPQTLVSTTTYDLNNPATTEPVNSKVEVVSKPVEPVVSKIEEVPEPVASKIKKKVSRKKNVSSMEQGVHYDVTASDKSTQTLVSTTTYNLINPASNTPNWIPKSFNFQDIDNIKVREGMMRLSNLIFVKSHDYPTLLETFVPLKKEYLRNQFGTDTQEIIKLGLETNLIETDNHYQVGAKSIGYRIGEQFRESPFRIININRNIHEDKNLKELLARNHHFRYLHTHLTSLTIDELALSRFRNDWKIWEPCQAIIAKAFYFKQDNFSGRIHTNLTNLKKVARGLLRINNGTETLWEVDIANSQPLFAAFASRAKGFNDEGFISLCEQGALYEALGDSWGVSRAEAKAETLLFFYAKNGYHSKKKTAFEKMFPTFSKFMHQCKVAKHQRFAELAQREERKLIIDAVVPEIIRRCPGAFLATVHDSLLVQERHVEIVRDVLTAQFLGQFGVVPCLHVSRTGGGEI